MKKLNNTYIWILIGVVLASIGGTILGLAYMSYQAGKPANVICVHTNKESSPVWTGEGRTYPKRPCPDCLLKHKWGACQK